jgi:hypothetical protein
MEAADSSLEKIFGRNINRLYEMDEERNNSRWILEMLGRGH